MKFASFDEKDKIEILLNILNERCHASHLMRERSLKFAMWILGFVAVGVPWLLMRGGMCLRQRVFLTILAILLGAATFIFTLAIHTGFNNNWAVLIKVEEALGFYEKDFFLKSGQLFPDKYKSVRGVSLSSHFTMIYLWLLFALIITLVSIWT